MNQSWIRGVSVLVIVIALGTIVWSLPVYDFAQSLHIWSRGLGMWSPLVFLGVFAAFTLCSLPVWPLPFVAGAVFGPLLGTVTASTSIVVAAATSFGVARLLGRTAFRTHLETSPRLRALEKAVVTADWRIVASVRLSHLLTFGLQNYAFGLTRIDFRTFLLTTWIVTLPGTLLQAYLGHLGYTSMDAWQQQAAWDWQTWSLRIGGFIVIAAAVSYIARWGKTVYLAAVDTQLQAAVKGEEPADAGWSWSSVVLPALAALFAAAAIWSVVERNTLRQYVERMLPQSRSFGD